MHLSKLLRREKIYKVSDYFIHNRDSKPNYISPMRRLYMNLPQLKIERNSTDDQIAKIPIRRIKILRRPNLLHKKNSNNVTSFDNSQRNQLLQNNSTNNNDPCKSERKRVAKSCLPTIIKFREHQTDEETPLLSDIGSIEKSPAITTLKSVLNELYIIKNSPQANLNKTSMMNRTPDRGMLVTPKKRIVQIIDSFGIDMNTKHKNMAELLNYNRRHKGPIAILEKFEEMVNINIQNVVKAISGNDHYNSNVKNLTKDDMHVDLCGLNDKIRTIEESYLSIYEVRKDFKINKIGRAHV